MPIKDHLRNLEILKKKKYKFFEDEGSGTKKAMEVTYGDLDEFVDSQMDSDDNSHPQNDQQDQENEKNQENKENDINQQNQENDINQQNLQDDEEMKELED